MKDNFKFHIITMSTYGVGLSGGDRIFIELSKKLVKTYPTSVYLWEEGLGICKREGLANVKFVLWSANYWAKFGFFINYFARIFIGISKTLGMKLEDSPQTIVYSASEFWQDSLPSFILKLRYPKIKWVAAWYQTAPNPFKGYSEEKGAIRYRFKASLYYLVQFPIKPIIRRFADLIIVNNENEKKEFPDITEKNRVFVMIGAVDLDRIKVYRSKHKKMNKIYDGVFQGRFHPQKGVIEMIDIWKMVVAKKSDAKLAMIGDGPLMNDVRNKIRKLNLEKNIELFGYVFDGPKKYGIFSRSKVVVHPAFYDSGGMASAEAMAFGLPVVGFDLVAYKSYYPKGMIKAKIGNLSDFAKQVLTLLNNTKIYSKLQKEGLRMIESNWSWEQRARTLTGKIETLK